MSSFLFRQRSLYLHLGIISEVAISIPPTPLAPPSMMKCGPYAIAQDTPQRRNSTFLEKTDGAFPTSQFQNVIASFLGEVILVLDHEMPSYRLWAGPCGIAKRTLLWDLMCVSYMSFKFLGSSVSFVAVTVRAEPLIGTLSTVLGTRRILYFLAPLRSYNLSRLDSLVWTFLEGRYRLWALPLIRTPVIVFAAMDR